MKNPPAGWDAIDGLIKDGDALTAGRQKLAKAALQCFAKKGYSNTSVNDIANAAGISIGSVYKYVRAKEDVLWLVSEAGFERTNVATAAVMEEDLAPDAKLAALVEALIRQIDSDRDLARLLYIEYQHMPEASKQRVREQEEGQLKVLESVIGAGVAAGIFQPVDQRTTAANISMFGSTWTLKRHFLDVSLDEYVANQQEAALRLVGAKAKAKGRKPTARATKAAAAKS